MITGKLSTTAAVMALIAATSGVAIAQDTQTPPPDAPAATQQDLPEVLTGLNLTDLEIKTKRHGIREIEGRTADGIEVEAKIDPQGKIIDIEAEGGSLPQSVIDALVPEAARGHEIMSMFAEFEEIEFRPDHYEVKGKQQNGDDIEAKFDPGNNLIGVEFEDGGVPDALIQSILPQAVRDSDVVGQFAVIEEVAKARDVFIVKGEDADGEDMGAVFDPEGRVLRFGREGDRDRERGERRFGDHGPRGGDGWRDGRGGPGRHGEGPGGESPRGDGPRGEHRRAGPPPVAPEFDPVAANQRLTEAGYTDFGFMRPQGPGVVLEATNPQGEQVLLELDPKGEVVRETAR